MAKGKKRVKKKVKRRSVTKKVMDKCMKCGVSFDGWMSKYLMGIKRSNKNKTYCNKCMK